MGKGLAGLLLGAVLAFSGCAYHKAELKEAVKAEEKEADRTIGYNWNGYTIKQKKLRHGPKNVVYEFKRRYKKDLIEDKCTATYYTYRGKITLEDINCDEDIEWITDGAGSCYFKDGPEGRFRNANKIFKYFKRELEAEKTHSLWEKANLWFDEMLW